MLVAFVVGVVAEKDCAIGVGEVEDAQLRTKGFDLGVQRVSTLVIEQMKHP